MADATKSLGSVSAFLFSKNKTVGRPRTRVSTIATVEPTAENKMKNATFPCGDGTNGIIAIAPKIAPTIGAQRKASVPGDILNAA